VPSPDQLKRFEAILKQTMDAVPPVPDSFPPLEIDEQNPLESLRRI
jgi:hypothetical protein